MPLLEKFIKEMPYTTSKIYHRKGLPYFEEYITYGHDQLKERDGKKRSRVNGISDMAKLNKEMKYSLKKLFSFNRREIPPVKKAPLNLKSIVCPALSEQKQSREKRQ